MGILGRSNTANGPDFAFRFRALPEPQAFSPLQPKQAQPHPLRNAMSSVKSWNAWMMARTGQGTKHPVGLDLCIRTMNQTGRDMKDDYRETARGGLALFYTQGC